MRIVLAHRRQALYPRKSAPFQDIAPFQDSYKYGD